MHPEGENEFMDRHRLSLELMKSIREIDVRIDTLKAILGDGPCPGQPERRQKLVEWIERLVETRFCLVYSFMDVNPSYKETLSKGESTNPFENFRVDYDSLKRQLVTGR